jgi:hypothetical protein
LLKLRKRRGLVIWGFALPSGVIALQYGLLTGLHAIDPMRVGPAGGAQGLGVGANVLDALGTLLAVIIGATVGTADVDAGVFTDLVASGRSRLALFAARVPGGLAFSLPIMAVAYAIAVGACAVLPGPGQALTAGLILRGAGQVLLTTAVWFAVALGVASLVGSRAVAIAILLGWQFIVEPALMLSGPLSGPWRGAALGAALTRAVPVVLEYDPNVVDSVARPSTAAAGVVLVWTGAALIAGAWRTQTRDA